LHQGRPVSCVQIFTKQIRLRRETIRLGGIGSVGTHPDHRGKGLASNLLRRAVEEMQTRNMALSLLFTGRFTFYEPLGWVSIPQSRLSFHARPGEHQTGRPFRPTDRADVERLYERYSMDLETRTTRDARYWDGQLAYAGSPDEEFRVLERGGRVVAYARRVQLFGTWVVMEYAREPDSAAELAGLIEGLSPEGGHLILPWGDDRDLGEELRRRARRLDPFPDASSMWRVLDRPLLAALAELPDETEDAALLSSLVGGPRALYWPSDRF
jgi:GNAT superfamily N-acetyltransferase